MPRMIVVGVSTAGLAAARELRAQGFDGQLSLIDPDLHPPYDRTALSKGLLTDASTVQDIALATEDELTALDADWHLGRRATRLRPDEQTLELDDGTELGYDGLVLATGSVPVRLPFQAPAGVHYLRSLDDALALRSALVPGVRLTLVGGGFVGLEIAAAARLRGAEVTVLEAGDAPLARALGVTVGNAIAERHRAQGVVVRTQTSMTGFAGGERLTGVELARGEPVDADLAVVGIGAVPAVDWLADSGLARREGVDADAKLATPAPGVVVAGDLARWPHPGAPDHGMVRIEHFEHAGLSGEAAARRLLHGEAVDPYGPLPFVWSHQFDHVLNVAGFPDAGTRISVLEGDLDDGPFVVEYLAGDRRVAVAALDDQRSFRRHRRVLSQLQGAPA